MPRHARSPIEDLRLAIDCLPTATKQAMLEGIRTNEIIVGAYTDRDGGVCPMLAAHRCGGRTSFVSFARAWDRFAAARKPRPASDREVRILEGQLVASLAGETPQADLGEAIRDHQTTVRDRRTREAAGTGGWGWLLRRRHTAPDDGEQVEVLMGEAREAPRERERELV